MGKARARNCWTTFCKAGLEGVVTKRADARYVGARSKAWLKTNCTRRQEFVVVGWTSSAKERGFRSLLLAVNEGGRLRYAGKVGNRVSISTKSTPADASDEWRRLR